MPAALVYFALFAVANWVAALRGWRRVEWVAKPGALAALIAYAALAPAAPALLLVALAASLAGDILLMLPTDAFTAGLAAFLVAQVAYVGALDAPYAARFMWLAVLVLACAPPALRVLRHVPGAALRAATVGYALALLSMAASAVASGPWTAALGGVLFVLSDGLLAWDRFVRRWWWAHAAVMVTYHLGQLGLTIGLAGR